MIRLLRPLRFVRGFGSHAPRNDRCGDESIFGIKRGLLPKVVRELIERLEKLLRGVDVNVREDSLSL